MKQPLPCHYKTKVDMGLILTEKGKGKVVPVLNLAPRHEGVLGE
jgi:hypothetical protein